jgi:amino-acid N-acetyltransferase
VTPPPLPGAPVLSAGKAPRDSVTLRIAAPADADAIVLVLRANFTERSLHQRTPADVLRRIAEFTVAEVDGRVVGCVGLHHHGDGLAEMKTLAVHPDSRGRGLGEALVEAAAARADAEGHALLWLATTKPDFFIRLGFVPISRWELPFRALLGKVPNVFLQPPARWSKSFLGDVTYLRRDRGRCGPTAGQSGVSPKSQAIE